MGKSILKKVIDANILIDEFNQLDCIEAIRIIETETGIKIPDAVYVKFVFSGLINSDLITSDFLAKHGIVLEVKK